LVGLRLRLGKTDAFVDEIAPFAGKAHASLPKIVSGTLKKEGGAASSTK
jgi:hypothetical protein